MRIFIVLLLAVQFLQSCKSQNYLVNELEVKDIKINTIIDSVYNSELIYSKIYEDEFLLLRIEGETKDKYSVRLAFLSKSSYSLILKYREKDKLIGYLNQLSIPIIVYGDNTFEYFSKTKRAMKFDFMKPEKKEKIKYINNIPPPPCIFDPQVWYYSIEKDTIKLEHVGLRTTILE